jgi:hypothetical protein
VQIATLQPGTVIDVESLKLSVLRGSSRFPKSDPQTTVTLDLPVRPFTRLPDQVSGDFFDPSDDLVTSFAGPLDIEDGDVAITLRGEVP